MTTILLKIKSPFFKMRRKFVTLFAITYSPGIFDQDLKTTKSRPTQHKSNNKTGLL